MRYGIRPLPGPAGRWLEAFVLGMCWRSGRRPVGRAGLAGESNGGAAWKDRLPFNLSGEIEAGGQFVNDRGNSATFDEYRDLNNMVTVPCFHLLGEDRARWGFVELEGTHLTRTDARYSMNEACTTG